jgi:hypothetical protein
MRTDNHRPSAIVPADYRFVLSYSMPSTFEGHAIPSLGINCARPLPRNTHNIDEPIVMGTHDGTGRCCLIALKQAGAKFAETGGAGKCSICGANYIYGDVWVHTPTGEHIHVGHDCADKYSLLQDHSAFQLALDRERRATATQLTREINATERAKFLADKPELAEALAQRDRHPILLDLDRKLTKWHSLSEKQIGLALKLAGELKNPKPVEAIIDTLEGLQTIVGEVLAVKVVESQFGSQIKMLVKVSTPEGSWKAWGTRPAAIADVDRGNTVRFTATFIRGNEKGFALFSRPKQATIVETVVAEDTTAAERVQSLPAAEVKAFEF